MIDPDRETHTHYLRGPNAKFLLEQLEQFIKNMQSNPDMEYEIIQTEMCLAIDFTQKDIRAG